MVCESPSIDCWAAWALPPIRSTAIEIAIKSGVAWPITTAMRPTAERSVTVLPMNAPMSFAPTRTAMRPRTWSLMSW